MSREPGPLGGRDERQPLPELVGWADSGGPGPGVNARALHGARSGREAGGGARRGDLLPLHAPQALTCWAQGRWGWKRVGNHQGPGQETTWGCGCAGAKAMLGTHVCLACGLGRLRTVSGEILAGSRVGGGGLCLGPGLPMWAFRLLRWASTSEVLGRVPSGGQRRRRHGLLKVSTREPASLGLGGGLGPEDRLHGGPCRAWSREVAFSLRSGHTAARKT